MSVVSSVFESWKVDCFWDECNGSPVTCVQTSLRLCQANSPSCLILDQSAGQEEWIFQVKNLHATRSVYATIFSSAEHIFLLYLSFFQSIIGVK